MNNEIEELEIGTESDTKGRSKSKRLLISGVVLLAVGLMVTTAAKVKGQLNLEEMKQSIHLPERPYFLSDTGSSFLDKEEVIESSTGPEIELNNA
jgi:hypothetical protein